MKTNPTKTSHVAALTGAIQLHSKQISLPSRHGLKDAPPDSTTLP